MKLFLIMFFIAGYLVAQVPNTNWVEVLALDDQNVFVDTSNIKNFEKQISALGLYIYKQPKLITEINKNASSAKARILFNQELKNYTIIGTLYYDANWKIIGETTLQTYTLGNISVGKSLDSNQVMLAIYNKCLQLIDTTEIVSEEKEKFKIISEVKKSESPIKINDNKITQTDSVAPKKKDRDILTEKFIDKKLNEDSKNPITIKNDNPSIKTQTKEKLKISQVYSSENEKNVKGMIFTDGNQFCFQVSSWKIKSQAEREVARLTNRGHNAFITEAYLSNRGGTWYRVRIGYFSSQAEAESYSRSMR